MNDRLRILVRSHSLTLLTAGLVAAACSGDHSLGEDADHATGKEDGSGGSTVGSSGASGTGGSAGANAGSGGTGGTTAGASGTAGSAGVGGTGHPDPDGGSDAEAGSQCCPISPQPGCCMDYGGTRGRAGCGTVCDGMPWPSPAWRIEQDEFGCPRWVEPPRIPNNCCGCFVIDAGVDAR